MKELEELYAETSEKMQKTVDVLKQEFTRIRTGRASPGLVEEIKVESYGTILPVKQLASIACPEPRLIVIRAWDPNSIPEIEKAILKSGVGLTPSNDGVAIKLPIPVLTDERRKEIVKMVHGIVEESRVALRNVRRDAIGKLKSIPDVPEDSVFKGKEKLQHVTDDYISQLDQLLAHKEKEITEE
jgi:ribosome recycling factor